MVVDTKGLPLFVMSPLRTFATGTAAGLPQRLRRLHRDISQGRGG
ncbi:hypothetical protein ACFXKF_26470 [Streptomyces scopuliridis]